MFTEPLHGRRQAHIREQRTAVDWAAKIQYLLDVQNPEASRVRWVCDNLNTEALQPHES